MDARRDYRVVLVGTVHGLERAELDYHLDQVMEELLQLESADPAAADPSLDVDFSTATVRMAVSIEAPDPIKATNAASGFIRSAIHAAGGATPDWPTVDGLKWALELTSLEAGQLVIN